ncbi:hypothetical protein D3C79_794500 [compost metagenome]
MGTSPGHVAEHVRVAGVGVDTDLHDAAAVLLLFLVLLGDQRGAGEVEEGQILAHGQRLALPLLHHLLHQAVRVWEQADDVLEPLHRHLHALVLVKAHGPAIALLVACAAIGVVQLVGVAPGQHLAVHVAIARQEHLARVTVGEALGIVVVRQGLDHAALHAEGIHQLGTAGERIRVVDVLEVDHGLAPVGQPLLDDRHVELAHLVDAHEGAPGAALPVQA